MAIDETGLTKGLVRKLAALRKSVGDDLAEEVFARWLEREAALQAKSKPDPVAMKIVEGLTEFENDPKFNPSPRRCAPTMQPWTYSDDSAGAADPFPAKAAVGQRLDGATVVCHALPCRASLVPVPPRIRTGLKCHMPKPKETLAGSVCRRLRSRAFGHCRRSATGMVRPNQDRIGRPFMK